MLTFSHLVTLLFFIVIGGIGMSSVQDGFAPVWRRLQTMFRREKVVNHAALARGQSLTLR